jgi:hypothetical protein
VLQQIGNPTPPWGVLCIGNTSGCGYSPVWEGAIGPISIGASVTGQTNLAAQGLGTYTLGDWYGYNKWNHSATDSLLHLVPAATVDVNAGGDYFINGIVLFEA